MRKNLKKLFCVSLLATLGMTILTGCTSREIENSEKNYLIRQLEKKYNEKFEYVSGMAYAYNYDSTIPSLSVDTAEIVAYSKNYPDITFIARANTDDGKCDGLYDTYERAYIETGVYREIESVLTDLWGDDWLIDIDATITDDEYGMINTESHDIIGKNLGDSLKSTDILFEITVVVNCDDYAYIDYNREQDKCRELAEELHRIGVSNVKEIKVSTVYQSKSSNVKQLEPDLIRGDYPNFIDAKNIKNKCNVYNTFNIIKRGGSAAITDYAIIDPLDKPKGEVYAKWIGKEEQLTYGLVAVIDDDTLGMEFLSNVEISDIDGLSSNYTLATDVLRVGYSKTPLIIDLDCFGSNIDINDIRVYQGEKLTTENKPSNWKEVTKEIEHYKDNKYLLFSENVIAIAIAEE